MPSFDISYTYDAAGNRLTKTDNQTSEVTTYSYDGANRLLSETDSLGTTNYEYDADGNRTKKETPSTTTFYEWDQENRLVEVEPAAGTVTLTYNGDGQRVKKETPRETTKFIYDFKRLLQETDGNDETQHLFTQTNDEYGDLVSEFGDGASSYFQYDALGSADVLLDADETATDRYQYQAFGLQDHTSGSSENRFTFVGRQNYYRDPELELYMLGMGNSDGGGRHYDPSVGAFVSQDPIEDDANLYRYVRNNPVNGVDPSGQQRAWSVENFVGKNRGSDYRGARAITDLRERRISPGDFAREYMAAHEAKDIHLVREIDHRLNLNKNRDLKRIVIGALRSRGAKIPPSLDWNTGSRQGGTSGSGTGPNPASIGSGGEGGSMGSGSGNGSSPSGGAGSTAGAPPFNPEAWRAIGRGLDSLGNALAGLGRGSAAEFRRGVAIGNAVSDINRELRSLENRLDELNAELDRTEERIKTDDFYELIWKCLRGDVGTEYTRAMALRYQKVLRENEGSLCFFGNLYGACSVFAKGEVAKNLKDERERTERERKKAIAGSKERMKEDLTTLEKERLMNLKMQERMIKDIIDGKRDVQLTVAMGREVSEGTLASMKLLIGLYGEFVTTVVSLPVAVGAAAASKGSNVALSKASKSKGGGALGKIKEALKKLKNLLKGGKPKRGLGKVPAPNRPSGYTKMQDYIPELGKPSLPASTRLSPEQAYALYDNLQSVVCKTLPGARGLIASGKPRATVLRSLQNQLNLKRWRFIDQVPGGRAMIDDILREFPELTFLY